MGSESRCALLQDSMIEQSFLGALLFDGKLLDDIPDDFESYHLGAELHAKIYDEIVKARNMGAIADPYTINDALAGDEQLVKAGGIRYLMSLTEAVLELGNQAHYANIITDWYIRRELYKTSIEFAERAKTKIGGERAISLVEENEKELYELAERRKDKTKPRSFASAMKESIDIATIAARHDGQLVGVTTGLLALDELLGGLHKSDLLVLAGRPSMGKTALATNIAFNAAKAKMQGKSEGAGVLFFSLEMSSVQLATRILSTETEIASHRIRRGMISGKEIDRFAECARALDKIELYIDDTPNATLWQIRAKARRMKRKHKVGLIVIDYLQLIEPDTTRKNRENRVQEIAEITRGLKGLARELDVPVLALSQLSRAVEQREDKRPQLSDLRESGAIEQDADVVMFIYREEYYKARREPKVGTQEHAKWMMEMEQIYNLADVIIAKQRHGPTDILRLFFDKNFTKFGNLELDDKKRWKV